MSSDGPKNVYDPIERTYDRALNRVYSTFKSSLADAILETLAPGTSQADDRYERMRFAIFIQARKEAKMPVSVNVEGAYNRAETEVKSLVTPEMFEEISDFFVERDPSDDMRLDIYFKLWEDVFSKSRSEEE